MLRHSLALLVIVGISAPAAVAQAVPPGPGYPAGPAGRAAREEIKEKIRALRIARVIEVLDLDERGAMRIAPILNRAYDEIGAVTRDSGEARRELRGLVDEPRPGADARINALVDRLLTNRARVEAIESRMIVEMRQQLPPAQIGRLVVALPEINREIQETIRNAAKRNRGPDFRDTPQGP